MPNAMASTHSNPVAVVAIPTLSVIVPCRNEAPNIESCLRSILCQQAPQGGFEIIVADGMSNDGTRAIVAELSGHDPRVRIIDNLEKIIPTAMNAGIRSARGRYIAILGAHAEYESDYLRVCVELLDERPEVCCVGGPIISKGKTTFGRAVAIAMSHPIGVGNAKHRFPQYEGYAEGACFPVFRREIFDKVGFYDEQLVKNQDDELNYRIALTGEKIFISPRAKCSYYVRDSATSLFRQYFEYGYWRVAVLRKHGSVPSMRQLIPVIFFLGMMLSLVAAVCLPQDWRILSIALPSIYLSILTVFGGLTTLRRRVPAGLLLPVVTGIMHLAYAAGFGWAVISPPSRRVAHRLTNAPGVQS